MSRTDWSVELLKVYQRHGRIDPDLLVEVARDPREPLHHHPTWTWDRDDAASWAWREQARMILNHAKVRYIDSGGVEQQVRAFHAVPVATDPGRYAWQPLEEVAQDEVTHKLVLREMSRRIKDLRAQYGHLKEYREAILSEAEELIAVAD